MVGRARLTLAAVALLTVVCALAALRLQPSTGIDTFVSKSSADSRATQTDDTQFGAAPVVVLLRVPISDLLQTRDLERVSELEACLAGQQLRFDKSLGAMVPVAAAKAKPYGGAASACGALMRTRPTQVVYGPGTFLNRAVSAVSGEVRTLTAAAAKSVQAAEAAALKLAEAKGLSTTQADAAAKEAGELALDQQLGSLGKLADQTGISSAPSIENPSFLSQIVLSSGTTPKARFAYLFPSSDAAVIQVRLRGSLSDSQEAQAISLIRRAVAMPAFKLAGGSYLVTGEPVVLSDVGASITGQLLLLLVGAAVVMALVLLIGFRRRLRLLPLVLALAAAGITFGLTSLVGGSLTMAAVAVLPILVGLGVDYGVQFQSGTPRRSVVIAALATAGGFLALLLSPVPMVQGFGLLLVAGVGIALAVVAVSVPAALTLVGRGSGAPRNAAPQNRPRVDKHNSWLWKSTRVPLLMAKRPRLVIAIGVVLAVAGWALETQTAVQSDITKLVPPGMPALKALDTLEQVTGVSGEIDVVVHANTVTTPKTVAWMISYEDRIVEHFGYSAANGCTKATLCPALSLPDLFQSATSANSTTATNSSKATALTQTSINSLLSTVPGYFQRAVLTADRRYATLAFGIRLMPLSQQRSVIAYMRSQLHPPAGVSASLAGLPVLAADADGALSSAPRRLLTLLAGLVLVAVVLFALFRERRRVIVALVPIVLATGWSALIVYLLRIPLNPMSASLGALVIAIATEFSVLLAERVRSEHATGWSLPTAIEHAYRSTGAAVVISGVTAIAGFGVLMLSNIAMLRDFGIVTLVDMTVSLVGVLLLLPAVIKLAEPPAQITMKRPVQPVRREPPRREPPRQPHVPAP